MEEYGVLSERKRRILLAVVEAHIGSGEPVGSKFLSNDTDLRCSSATIRNEMAELEAMGYLEQPHTSAGRVPSAMGYRFYVDELLNRYSETAADVEQLDRALRQKLTRLDQIFTEASRIASTYTNYTGIAARPPVHGATISRFECVPVDRGRFVLVMLLSDGSVQSRYITTETPVTREELSRLSEALNSLLTDRPAATISLPIMMELEARMGSCAPIVSQIVKTVYATMTDCGGGEVRVEGVNRLLQYPEYADPTELRSLFGVIESKDEMMRLIGGERDERVHVRFGDHSESERGLGNSALVYRTILRDGKAVGVIGVIGPRRMDYPKVIGTLENLASEIDTIFREAEGERSLPSPEKHRKE